MQLVLKVLVCALVLAPCVVLAMDVAVPIKSASEHPPEPKVEGVYVTLEAKESESPLCIKADSQLMKKGECFEVEGAGTAKGFRFDGVTWDDELQSWMATMGNYAEASCETIVGMQQQSIGGHLRSCSVMHHVRHHDSFVTGFCYGDENCMWN